MPALPSSSSGSYSSSTQQYRQQLLTAVNSYRAAKGAGPLRQNATLDRMAQQHCEYLMKNRGKFGVSGTNVSHIGFDGRAAVANRVLNMKSFAENVAFAHKGATPSRFVTLWHNSPTHRFAMSGAGWEDTGIGVVIAPDGGIFATQLFGTVDRTVAFRRQF